MILTCAAVCPAVSAADHVVAPSGAEFTSIKDAVDWSSGGDTIRVESGTYAENIKLDKKIVLIGVDSGNGAPVIQPERTAMILRSLPTVVRSGVHHRKRRFEQDPDHLQQ